MNIITTLKEKFAHKNAAHPHEHVRLIENIRSMSIQGIWALLLGMFVVLVLGAVLFSTLLFFRLERDELFPTTLPNGREGSEVSREEIFKVLETIEERAALFETLKTRRPVPGVVLTGTSATVPETLMPVDPIGETDPQVE